LEAIKPTQTSKTFFGIEIVTCSESLRNYNNENYKVTLRNVKRRKVSI